MKINQKSHKLIRPLEGYRALAIISVLIFHLEENLLSGGYLGVDLFFVISGFIITKGLINAKANGTLNLWDFYAKRFRRLFPALLVTTILTLIGSYFILDPSGFASTGKAAMFSLFSLANVNFWMEAGYFAADSKTKPLLHMWSLSVEEQFYLFWPFVLILFSAKFWKVWALVLFVFSLSVSIYYSGVRAETAFFWFPFRVYEFMGGAIISIIGLHLKNNVLASLSLIIGFVLFIFACFAFDQTTNIVLAGGVTVLSGVLLLLSLDCKISRVVFGNTIFVWIGQRSYSVYLVHWPLIVLYIFEFGPLSNFEIISLGLTSFALGSLLKWLIEDPFRQSSDPRSLPARRAYPLIVGTAAVSVFASSTVWGYQGFPGRVDLNLEGLIAADERYETLIKRGTCFQTQRQKFERTPSECYLPKPNTKNMLIIGNSYAADLRPGMESAFPEWHILQLTRSNCPPMTTRSKNANCTALRNMIYEDVLENYSYDLVLLTGFVSTDINPIKRIMAYMEKRDIDYVILGPRPRFDVEPHTIIAKYGSLDGLDSEMQSHIYLRKEIDIPGLESHYFSSNSVICPSSEACIWQLDGKRVYRDKNHIFSNGSEYLAENFAKWYKDRNSP